MCRLLGGIPINSEFARTRNLVRTSAELHKDLDNEAVWDNLYPGWAGSELVAERGCVMTAENFILVCGTILPMGLLYLGLRRSNQPTSTGR
jgi:hypothetical protein